MGVSSNDWVPWEAVSPHIEGDGPSLVIQCQGKAMPKGAGGHLLLLHKKGQTNPFAPRLDAAPNQGCSCQEDKEDTVPRNDEPEPMSTTTASAYEKAGKGEKKLKAPYGETKEDPMREEQ